jgi:hypothetical protein
VAFCPVVFKPVLAVRLAGWLAGFPALFPTFPSSAAVGTGFTLRFTGWPAGPMTLLTLGAAALLTVELAFGWVFAAPLPG